LEEALRMAEYAKTLRDKTMILFMAYSGLRNNTLLAIKFGDIREELEHGVEPLLIKVYPEMKKLVSSAAKGNVGYFTFVPKNVVEVLKLYVAQKRERMGAILDDYPLFSSEHNQLLKKDRFGKPLSARQLEVIVKRAAKDAGIIKWKFVHPHCLRKTCDSFLRSQLCDGGRLDIQTQIYFMGHTLPGGLKPYFDARVEDMRKEYSKLVPLPNEAKLNKVTEALKALADALRISRTQSPLGVRDEVSANQGKKAYDAFQAFLEEFGLVNVGENHS
jgi:integrase